MNGLQTIVFRLKLIATQYLFLLITLEQLAQLYCTFIFIFIPPCTLHLSIFGLRFLLFQKVFF
jgi:hypothetical protein